MTTPNRSSTNTLISAVEILAKEIHSDDGVANACLFEVAERLKELSRWQSLDNCPKNESLTFLVRGDYNAHYITTGHRTDRAYSLQSINTNLENERTMVIGWAYPLSTEDL